MFATCLTEALRRGSNNGRRGHVGIAFQKLANEGARIIECSRRPFFFFFFSQSHSLSWRSLETPSRSICDASLLSGRSRDCCRVKGALSSTVRCHRAQTARADLSVLASKSPRLCAQCLFAFQAWLPASSLLLDAPADHLFSSRPIPFPRQFLLSVSLRSSPYSLPGIKLPENVVAVPDLVKAVEGATALVFVLPHQCECLWRRDWQETKLMVLLARSSAHLADSPGQSHLSTPRQDPIRR